MLHYLAPLLFKNPLTSSFVKPCDLACLINSIHAFIFLPPLHYLSSFSFCKNSSKPFISFSVSTILYLRMSNLSFICFNCSYRPSCRLFNSFNLDSTNAFKYSFILFYLLKKLYWQYRCDFSIFVKLQILFHSIWPCARYF